MKLSQHTINIECAYNSLLHEISAHREHPKHAFNFIRRRPHHILPR
jgi:hypothetical protein